jgi:hypothetical protein
MCQLPRAAHGHKTFAVWVFGFFSTDTQDGLSFFDWEERRGFFGEAKLYCLSKVRA